MHSLWLEEGKLWRFRIRDEHRLLPLPDRRITDFGNSVEQLRCMPDEAFLRNPRNMSGRPPSTRRTRAQDAQAPPLPDFPNIPDIPMHDQGDFQRFVVDALQAIWASLVGAGEPQERRHQHQQQHAGTLPRRTMRRLMRTPTSPHISISYLPIMNLFIYFLHL
ncbi:hypothetical protein HID58_037886 [Brassica napus]|uniref:Uncharacterized protein n=1 Tax=Brassica napus TaxID=3708 RepID=A0ABQ8BMQ9_BRANA|nr:hypothetical protein HID58_037886 [Brassica napus]